MIQLRSGPAALRRLLLLVLAIGCGGTETGNPFVAELRLDAHSSDPARISVRTGDSDVVVTEAWLVLDGIELSEPCAGDGGAVEMPPALGASDHAAGGAVLVQIDLVSGEYCRMLVPLSRAGEPLPAEAPPELEGHSVLLAGEVAAPTPTRFRLASAFAGTVNVQAIAGSFEMSQEAGPVFLGFDVAAWLGELDLAAAETDAEGVIVIDADRNPSLLAEFEAAFAGGIELYRDVDGDGAVSGPEDELLARGLPAP
jgi:hypothetical protein